jgi:hypothetical protein
MKKQLFYMLLIGLCSQHTNIYGVFRRPLQALNNAASNLLRGPAQQSQDQRERLALERQSRLNDFANNLRILKNPNFKIIGDIEFAHPRGGGVVYQIINLIDNNNNWNAKAAAFHRIPRRGTECPELTCGIGLGCRKCFPFARCTLEEATMTLTCATTKPFSSNPNNDYTHYVSWTIANGGDYNLARDQNGNPILLDQNSDLVKPK